MKKILDIGSLVGIVAALVLIGYLFLPQRPAQAATDGGAFKDFPVGQTRVISLAAGVAALEELTPRERLDQTRDWLMFAAVSYAGLSADDINKALFDRPVTRQRFMRQVANFEYGDTRACYIGNGLVLALLPADASEERADRLARIADEHRKNLGALPSRMLVFEYELRSADDGARQTALLTRREPVRVEDLYTAAAGYHEAKIGGPEDLRRFMGQVDDLTYASLKDGLTLGGRKIKGHAYHGIRVEEVAALYQSEAKLRERGDAFARKAASGFSLDPAYDYAKLAARFDAEIAPELRRLLPRDASDIPVAQSIAQAREGLARNEAGPLLELLYRVQSTGQAGADAAHKLEQKVLKDSSYQAARYDGELRGTETGMVLFYTDLLAKLWAMNYRDSAPADDVPGFTPMTALRISSVFRRELEELSHTRLWFGTQDRGFQVADGGQSLLFGRVATRVYAASSNSFKPGVETEANAQSAAFLGWWDDHYEEIARFEPEYERLNEIMKWSLVVGWLNQKEQADRLGFLRSEKVESANWFPDWVERHPELRYRHWDNIFNQRGFGGATTETLPLLESEKVKRVRKVDPTHVLVSAEWIKGGVSLAGEETFVSRAALSAETKVAQTALRSNLNLAESAGSTLKTFEGTVYKLSSAGADNAATTATARAGAKLRGSSGEFANQPIERTVTRAEGSVSFRSLVGDVPQGELTVGEAGNGFSLAWASRDTDTGASLARRLSAAQDPARVLALDPDVGEAIALPGNGYLVRLEGSNRWLKVTPEAVDSTSLSQGSVGRVGGFRADAKNYDLAWVKPEEASESLARGARRLRQAADQLAGDDMIPRALASDYGAAARSLSQYPEGFKAQLETYLSRSIEECNDMLRGGQFEMASRHLDALIGLYGPRPDLRLRKVVADLNVPRRIRSELAGIVTGGGDHPTIYDELSAQLNKSLPLARRPRGVQLILVDNDVAVRYESSEPLIGEPVAHDEVGRMRALVYVQDEPGFNNIDWPFSPQQTIQEAISGRFQARVIKLPRGDIARLKPAVIYDSAEGLTFKAADLGGRGHGVLQPRYFIGDRNPGRYGPGGRFVPRFYLPIVPCMDDDDDKDEDGRSVKKDEDDDDCDDDDDDTEVVVVRR